MNDAEHREESKKLPQYVAALSACLGAVCCGTVLGWTANTLPALKAGDLNDVQVDDAYEGWLGSMATLGALFSCIPTGYLCDRFGRKRTMLALAVPFVAGWLMLSFANSVTLLLAGRLVTGYAGGAFCVAAPLYCAEVSVASIRGTLGSFFQLLLTVGILLAYVVSAFVDVLAFTYLCTVLPLVFAGVFVLQPESPVYLLKRGDVVEATRALTRLRGESYARNGGCAREIDEIKASLSNGPEARTTTASSSSESYASAPKRLIRALKHSTQAKRAVAITLALMFFQQLSGINAVIFYAGTIFDEAGTSLQPEYASIVVGAFQVVATFASSIVIDRLGRRVLLIFSDVSMALSGALLGAYFTLRVRHLVDEETVQSLSFLPVFAVSVFIVVFSLGFGPIPWMIASEISPAEIKSVVSSTGATVNWFLAFIVTLFFVDLKKALKEDVTFYLFAVISLLGAVFVYFVVPETKGKSLEQIQLELGGVRDNSKRSSRTADGRGDIKEVDDGLNDNMGKIKDYGGIDNAAYAH